MLGNALGGWHWIVILLIVVLLFGAPKLPVLAKSLGQSMRIFRAEMKTNDDGSASVANAASTEAGDTATNS